MPTREEQYVQDVDFKKRDENLGSDKAVKVDVGISER